MFEDLVNAAVDIVNAVWGFFVNVAPHNFGVILIPILILGAIAILAARRPHPL